MTLRGRLSRISTPQRVAAGAVFVLLLVVAQSVLPSDAVSAPRASPSPPLATPTPTPTPSPTPSPTPTPTPSPTPTPTPTPEPNPDELNVTILLVGRDALAARVGERGMNTDMLIVANIHADGSRIDLMSLPRDSVDVPLGDGTVWSGKINSLRAARGLPALTQAMSTALGIPIDYYAEITMDDLIQLVNAIGGVTVNLAAPLNDPHLLASWRAGENRLDGRTAVLFVRSRYADSDYARADRNQLLLIALRNKLLAGGYDPLALLTSLRGLATDIPPAEMPMLLELARRSADAPITRKVLRPPEFTLFTGSAGARGWVSIPDLGAIRAYAESVFAHR